MYFTPGSILIHLSEILCAWVLAKSGPQIQNDKRLSFGLKLDLSRRTTVSDVSVQFPRGILPLYERKNERIGETQAYWQ